MPPSALGRRRRSMPLAMILAVASVSPAMGFLPSALPRRAPAFFPGQRRPFHALQPHGADVTHVRRLAAGHVGISAQPCPSQSKRLLAAAISAYMLFVVLAPTGLSALFVRGLVVPFARNVPMAMACFGGADVATQAITGAGASLDLKRAFAACAVGVLCNAVGLVIWLHWLDALIPKATIGLAGMRAFANLACKTIAHSFVWGTISNSLSIWCRRIMAGDSLHDATAFWDEKILPIMQAQFWFWPVYQGLTFALVPQKHQVAVTALGAFAFNIFMSLMGASKAPEE